MRPTRAIQLCSMLLLLGPLLAIGPLGDAVDRWPERALRQIGDAVHTNPYLRRTAALFDLAGAGEVRLAFGGPAFERHAQTARHRLRLLREVADIRMDRLLPRRKRGLGRLGEAVWMRLSDFDLRRVAYAVAPSLHGLGAVTRRLGGR